MDKLKYVLKFLGLLNNNSLQKAKIKEKMDKSVMNLKINKRILLKGREKKLKDNCYMSKFLTSRA